MSFGQAIASGFNKYATFAGRASRSEFWWWVLFACLVTMAASMADAAVGASPSAGGTGPIAGLTGLALLLPGIAITVRRLHDVDRTGWWYLIAFTIIGLIPLLIWNIQRGTAGSNRFGSDPVSGVLPGSAASFQP